MNKLITKIVGAALGLTMAVGVGVAVGASRRDSVPVYAASGTWTWTVPSSVPDGLKSSGTVTLNGMTWSFTRSETTTTSRQTGGTYTTIQYGKNGSPCNITFEGTLPSTYGNAIKSVGIYTASYQAAATCTIYVGSSSTNLTQILSANTARWTTVSEQKGTVASPVKGDTYVKIELTGATRALYLGDMSIEGVEIQDTSTPDFSLDKNNVNLTLGGSATTVTATPNEYVADDATYTWSKTAGDDCVTLTNANTATVTIAPKGTAVSASCTLTIAVTGCTSKTVSVTVKKVSSQSNPFSVAEAIDLVNTGVAADMADVYVHGIISQVDSFNSQYSSITYWISDDGTTTNQFQVYSGKGLDNADFSSVSDLQVGYEVVVFGTVKDYNGTKEFDKNNYIVSLIRPNTFTVTTSTSGLTLSVDEIGTTGSVSLSTAAKKKGSNVTVSCGTGTATVNENLVTLSDVDENVEINATIVDASITSIALSGQTTKFALGGTFSFDGTVTGTYDDWTDPHTSEEIASGYTVNSSAVNMSVEGTYTVTVSYNGVNASYDVRVVEMFDNTKGEYHKVTDLSQLYDGAHVAIVDADEEYSMKSGFTSTNNVTATSVTKDATTNTISKTGVLDVELVKTGTNEYRFKIDEDLYLYAASSGSNHLKASTLSTTGDNGKFLISLSNGTFGIVAQGTYSRNVMRFNPNNGSPVFSCYASSSTTGTTPAIYVFETYQEEANGYAETFIKGNGSANTCAATIENWTNLGTAFGKLTAGAKKLFREAEHEASETYTNPSEYTVEHAVARYDDALLKHIELRSNEFMDRTTEGTLSYSSKVSFIGVNYENGSTAAIIVVVSLVSLTAVGGYFFIRKRKEQ